MSDLTVAHLRNVTFKDSLRFPVTQAELPLNGETYYSFSNLYYVHLAAQLLARPTSYNQHVCMVIFLQLNISVWVPITSYN